MRLLSIVSACLLVLPACSTTMTDEQVDQRAREIQETVVTIDTHVDIEDTFGSDQDNPCVSGDHQTDLPKMEAGGLDVAFFVVYVAQTVRSDSAYVAAWEAAMTKFNGIHRVAEELCPERAAIAYSADDVERLHAEGKRVIAIGVENGFVIGKDLALVERSHELGARYITLAHNGNNDIADSAQPDPELGDTAYEFDGVSPFGEEVIAEMNRLGIMVDVSHISKAAMLDAVRLSKTPVIASHSSVRALVDHPRNMDDEQLVALAQRGGVIQITAVDDFIETAPPALEASVDSTTADVEPPWPGPGVPEFVDHIDYAVRLVGIDHVGISSDFDGGGGLRGWDNAAETLNVTRELVRRGYDEEQIRKLWGGNLLRVWRQVEKVSTQMRAGG